MMTLLSPNDRDALRAAMRRLEELTLVRTLGDEEVAASVVPVRRPWAVAVAVQVRYRKGRVEWVQTFESVEAIP